MLQVKPGEFLEFEGMIPPRDRDSITDFRIGDTVLASWDDGEQYEATILNIDGELVYYYIDMHGSNNIINNNNYYECTDSAEVLKKLQLGITNVA